MLPSFTSWLHRRKGYTVPESDRVVPLIAQAGVAGMNRGQIGAAVDLERDVLDELLAGLVRFGELTVSDENGLRVFRAQMTKF